MNNFLFRLKRLFGIKPKLLGSTNQEMVLTSIAEDHSRLLDHVIRISQLFEESQRPKPLRATGYVFILNQRTNKGFHVYRWSDGRFNADLNEMIGSIFDESEFPDENFSIKLSRRP